MKRRDVIGVLIGAAASPLTARAEQPERVRRVGVLSSLPERDTESIARRAVFEGALQAQGWAVGRNLRIDYRWTNAEPALLRNFASELIALAPDVVLASGNSAIAPMLQAARTTPIVFAQVIDPVGSGFIESMARPGANVTGFTQFEYSLAGKWLDLLKEVAPGVTRVAVVRDPTRGPGIGQFAVIQAMAATHAVELTAINANDPLDAQTRRIAAFAASPGGGLIVTPGTSANIRSELIPLVAKNRVPAIYPYRYFAVGGGLLSYGPDTVEQFRRVAGYVARILKGEKPAELPVQAPNKYELVINLITAKTLGIDVPPLLLARADQVIE